MLGKLIASLDQPHVALDLVAAMGKTTLPQRIGAAADASGREPSEIVASAVRRFLDTASDEEWLQLMGIMTRAPDPGLAALRAILEHALPAAREIAAPPHRATTAAAQP